LGFFALAIGVSFENQIFLAPLAWSVTACFDRRAFRILLDWKLLLFLAFIVLLVPVICGSKDALALGVPYSTELLQAGLVMAQRSLIILLGLRVFTGRVSVGDLSFALRQSRFQPFGQVFTLAIDSLPQIRSIAAGAFRDFRQSESRKARISTAFEFLVAFLVRLLLYAQSVPSDAQGSGVDCRETAWGSPAGDGAGSHEGP
jgi:hypothetical protein